jgi:hypothetical protein
MWLVREPLEVDLYVKSRPLTRDEKKSLSDFIQQRKVTVKNAGRTTYKRGPKKNKK